MPLGDFLNITGNVAALRKSRLNFFARRVIEGRIWSVSTDEKLTYFVNFMPANILNKTSLPEL